MKRTLTLALFTFLFVCGATFADNMTELIRQLRHQQARDEQKIIELWKQRAKQDKIDPILKDYVVREIRLRSLVAGGETGTLLGAVLSKHPAPFETTQALTQALAIEFLRRRGLLAKPYFVRGRYEIVPANQH
ncbi:MAG: hypothetical protein D6820_11450 [Lentisphaerae bacterium]|nr:MAG: hypothetical protein D6820_11450 [Lentisphaerota bacterium]